MCLRVSTKTDAQSLLRYIDSEITVYKVLEYNGGNLRSPYYNTNCWASGGVVSNRAGATFGSEPGEGETWTNLKKVHRGIHVCLTMEEARRIKSCIKNDYPEKRLRIVKMTAQLKDMVAIGHFFKTEEGAEQEAVFHKVYFSKEDYARGLKRSL